MGQEEGSECVGEMGWLARFAHCLHQMRQGSEFAPDEPNDELVVAGVEAMACEPNVVSELLRAVGHSNLRVLPQDLRLLVRLEAREGSAPPKRRPDSPPVVLFGHVLDG